MRVLLAVLLVVGLVGCGSETEPPSPFSESEAKPPTAAVPPTPPESTQAKVENVVADTPQPKVDADPVSKPKSKSEPGSEPNVSESLREIGQDSERIIELATGEETGEVYSCQTESAQSKGIFGRPSFIVDGELFWGDDRLEDAVYWALR